MIQNFNMEEVDNVVFNGNNLDYFELNDKIIWGKNTKGLVYVPAGETVLYGNTVYLPLLDKVLSDHTFNNRYTYFSYNQDTELFKVESVTADSNLSGLYYSTAQNASPPTKTGFLYVIDYIGQSNVVVINKTYNNEEIKGWTTFSTYENKAIVEKLIIFGEQELLINDNGFKGWTLLKDITLPNTIQAIGANAFKDTAFYKDNNNWENGYLKLNSWLIGVDSNLTNVTIDEDVTICASRLFADNYLEVVNFNAPNLKNLFYADGIFRHYPNIAWKDNSASYPNTTLNISSNVKRLPSYFLVSGLFRERYDAGGTERLYGGFKPNPDFLINNNIEELSDYALYSIVTLDGQIKSYPTWENITEENPLIIPDKIKNMTYLSFNSGAPYYRVETNVMIDEMFRDTNAIGIEIKETISNIPIKCFASPTGALSLQKIKFEQPSGMSVTLPTAGSSTGMLYCKTASSITIYTDNEIIKNYDYATDNVTATIYHLDGSSWE